MKEKITIEEFVEFLYYFALKFGKEAVDHELSNEKSPFKDADRDVFIHERMIMIFWIIDMLINDEKKKIISAVHKKYFKDNGLLDNLEEAKKEVDFITNRYKEYYGALDDKAGAEQHILGGMIAKNILQKDKMVVNYMTTYLTIMDVFLLIKELKESIIDKYELIDK